MKPRRTINRAMFWRIIRRLLGANRGRLFVILLALSAGAAVTAALLNLQVDAKRRLTTEFRAFGANVLISPSESAEVEAKNSLNPAILDSIPSSYEGGEITKVGFTHVVIEARVRSTHHSFDDRQKQWKPSTELPTAKGYKTPGPDASPEGSRKWSTMILVGLEGHNVQHVLPSEFVETSDRVAPDMATCRIGQTAAKQLNAHPGYVLDLRSNSFADICYVSTVES